MIYFFFGSDTNKIRTKAFAWVAAARAKEPQLMYTRLSVTEITDSALLEASSAGGLFVKRLLILIDDPFAKTQTGAKSGKVSGVPEILMAHLDSLAESDNAIVILAPQISATYAKKIIKKAMKEYKFDHTRAERARGFNSALANALSARDSKKLWLEIVRALRAGDAPEMLHGLLHWKARDIMEKGSRAWTSPEARALSLRLIALLEHTRSTGADLAMTIERFALRI